jgi:hypothetical protein
MTSMLKDTKEFFFRKKSELANVLVLRVYSLIRAQIVEF